MAHQSRRCRCRDADAVREALKKLELFVVSENVRSQRHRRRRRRMCCCRPRPGARRTARSPIPSAASRASARSCRRRARRGRTGGSSREVAQRHGLWRRRSPIESAADIFREHAALSAFENDGSARFRHRRARRTVATTAYDALTPVQWPVPRRATRPHARFFADGGFFTTDGKARFIAPELPALRSATSAELAAAAQHRPHPRPVAHHDAHRPEPAARRSICRSRSSRSIPTMPASSASPTAASRASPPTTAQCIAESRRQRAPAARHAVRADPLERRRTRSPARVGALVRAFTDPFSGQPESKATPASIAPYEYVFRGFALSRKPLDLPPSMHGGRASRSRAATAICFADNADLARWQAWLTVRRRRRRRRISRISAAAFIARRRLPATASRPACSSAPRMTPATGTW